MALVGEGLLEALRLLVTGDPEVWRITVLSFQVSGSATLLSLLAGIPLGTLLALARFPGRALAISLVNTGMGLPPVVVGLFVTILTLAAIQQVPGQFRLQMLGLGASRAQMIWMLLREARLLMLAAVMAGFGGVISEVGASMMVGGNIKGSTRVLTTATVLETGKGNFDVAIALGLILLALCFALNFLLTHIQQRGQMKWPRLS